jgi:acetyl-CoA carboxylase carboxyltransferase component
MTSNSDRLDRLAQLRANAVEGGMRIPQGAQLSPRERITKLLDEGGFFEISQLAVSQQPDLADSTPEDGVITGFGTVNGRPVAVVSEVAAVLEQSDRQVGLMKRTRLLKLAKSRRHAVVYFSDGPSGSPPFEVTEGMLHGHLADDLSEPEFAGDTQPLIIVRCGRTWSVNRGLFSSADVVVSWRQCDAEGCPYSIPAFDCASDKDAVGLVRTLLELVPGSHDALTAFRASDRVGTAAETFDTSNPIESVLDRGTMILLRALPGQHLAAALGRVQGWPVCALFNPSPRPAVITLADLKTVSCAAALSARRGIPLVSMQDWLGYETPTCETAMFQQVLSQAIVEVRKSPAPKFALIVGKGHVLGDFALGGRRLGFDWAGAWPWASVGIKDVQDCRADVLEEDREDSPWLAAGLSIIDDVLLPSETAARLAALIEIVGRKNLIPAEPDDGRLL